MLLVIASAPAARLGRPSSAVDPGAVSSGAGRFGTAPLTSSSQSHFLQRMIWPTRLLLTLSAALQFSQTTRMRSASGKACASSSGVCRPVSLETASASAATKLWPHCLQATVWPRYLSRTFNVLEHCGQAVVKCA